MSADHNNTPAELVAGDLVVFTGYTYTPDYAYREHYNKDPELGIVIRPARGNYHAGIYKIFWLKTGRSTECQVGHLRLAYTEHTSA